MPPGGKGGSVSRASRGGGPSATMPPGRPSGWFVGVPQAFTPGNGSSGPAADEVRHSGALERFPQLIVSNGIGRSGFFLATIFSEAEFATPHSTQVAADGFLNDTGGSVKTPRVVFPKIRWLSGKLLW